MAFKFAPNISTMFTESPNLLQRYELAAQYGFTGVECQNPYDYDIFSLVQHKENCGLEQVLINSYGVERATVLSEAPGSYESFKSNLYHSLEFASNLQCKRLHVLADFIQKDVSFEVMEDIYITRLLDASDICQAYNVECVIEPMCKQWKPDYFLSNFTKALEYVKRVNRRNVKLLLDIYHLQMMCGNLTQSIRSAITEVGHVQISQAPMRNEPSSPGEINYRYVLSLLESLDYDGWIGLEYYPSGSTADSLNWIPEYGYEIH